MDTSKSTIIVLHPGSQTIKFGLSSDNYPQSIPNVIARKVNPSSRAKSGQSSNGTSTASEHRTTEKLKLLEQIEQKLTNWRLRRNEEESGMIVDPLAHQDVLFESFDYSSYYSFFRKQYLIAITASKFYHRM